MRRMPPSRRRQGARYFSGDWTSLGELVGRAGLGGAYDIILSAETIYSPDSQLALYECLKQVGYPKPDPEA